MLGPDIPAVILGPAYSVKGCDGENKYDSNSNLEKCRRIACLQLTEIGIFSAVV
jgi:hypothetical protein